jgi:hypothetical protein
MVTITTITEGLQRYNHTITIIIISSSWSGNSITHTGTLLKRERVSIWCKHRSGDISP